ncbi:glycosyltransferase [Butyrivibrio sp. XPD2006]|uniref:glycosyltransferase n=1 Tax=Butyrivibrio sp. XPD2006 TaxID=1280668 RepID=UPI0003B44B15|nr:glycosyltransferase family 2 protein [Butyrivibrio sp. XPD2006]
MTNPNPLVSVIIPVFRVEKYLEKGVNSIINQTYDNLQIILVDDGSDDGCPQICDEFAKRDNRIISLHKTNGGLSDARNYGLNYATGKYIYFFDSDDYLDADAIKKLVDVAENTGFDAVAFGYKKVDESAKLLEESHMTPGEYFFSDDKQRLDFICHVLCAYKVGWEAWNRLFKADIIKDNNIRFEPNKEIFAEDRCFNIYYTLCSKSMIFIGERFYNYLIRDDSIMGNTQKAKINENIRLMDYIKRFAINNGHKYVAEKWQYINIALFIPVLAKIDKSEYRNYRSTWKCNDISDRFGNILKRPFIFISLKGFKRGIKNYKMFEKFISFK